MIRTQGLCYQYPNGPLLAFPDVDVPQGAVLLLSGPSGCGKSTWLALAAALVAPTAGALVVAEQSLGALKSIAADAWRARAIGFLPQKLHLSAALSVHRNLAMAQWAAGQFEDALRIHAALQALGVENLAARKPGQLSGGQAQRVALARAVLLQPRVILAEEPTAMRIPKKSPNPIPEKGMRAKKEAKGVGLLCAACPHGVHGGPGQ